MRELSRCFGATNRLALNVEGPHQKPAHPPNLIPSRWIGLDADETLAHPAEFRLVSLEPQCAVPAILMRLIAPQLVINDHNCCA